MPHERRSHAVEHQRKESFANRQAPVEQQHFAALRHAIVTRMREEERLIDLLGIYTTHLASRLARHTRGSTYLSGGSYRVAHVWNGIPRAASERRRRREQQADDLRARQPVRSRHN